MTNEDLYNVLGVSRNATKEEIKKSYRKLARELHPDRNKDNKEAEERFKKVSAAYTVLGDEEKRKIYDQYGIDGLRDGFDPSMWQKYGGVGGGRNSNAGGFDFGGQRVDFGGFQGFGAMEDIFENLFGGRRGRGRPGKSRASWGSGMEKGPSVRSKLEVELMDAVLGRELELIVPIEGEQKKLKVKIPEGIESGKTIRLKEQGGRSRHGGAPGDLMLEIVVRKDRNYERDGIDLIKKEKITVKEAYEGTQKEVETPWGALKVTIPPGTQGGSRMRLKGKGIKKGEESGDLYLLLVVQIPTKRDKKTKNAVEQLDKCY